MKYEKSVPVIRNIALFITAFLLGISSLYFGLFGISFELIVGDVLGIVTTALYTIECRRIKKEATEEGV